MRATELSVPVGATRRLSVGYLVLAAKVDNPSTGWVIVDGIYRIPPLSFGGVITMVPGTPNPTIVNAAVDPSGNPVVDNGQSATIVLYDEAVPAAPPAVQSVVIGGVVVASGWQDVRQTVAGVQKAVGDGGGGTSEPLFVKFGAAQAVTGPLTDAELRATAVPVSLPVASKAKLRNLAAVVQTVKAGPGLVYGIQVYNGTGATAYVRLFDKAAAGVNLAVDTTDLLLTVAAGATVNLPTPAGGIAFTVEISIASTTTEAGAVGSAAGVMAFAQFA